MLGPSGRVRISTGDAMTRPRLNKPAKMLSKENRNPERSWWPDAWWHEDDRLPVNPLHLSPVAWQRPGNPHSPSLNRSFCPNWDFDRQISHCLPLAPGKCCAIWTIVADVTVTDYTGGRILAVHQLPSVLIARATRMPMTTSEIEDRSIISTLAWRERTMVSVGLKAVLVLKARKR